jgi:hypothetical protein
VSAAVSLDTKHHLVVLTNSELRTWRLCARRHKFQYRLRRRPKKTHEALAFGTLWHLGLEHWWAAPTPEARLASGLTALRSSPGVDPFALATCEVMLIAYTALYGEQTLETVCVEQSFEVPLVNPETGVASRTYRIGGKFDGIARDGDRLVVVEHKTTASDIEQGSLYWKRVQTLDTQVSLYLAGARAAGYAVEACLYDVARKPGLKPLKATPEESRKWTKPTKADPTPRIYANQREHNETPEEYAQRVADDIAERPERYFSRAEIVRLEKDDDGHAYDTWQQARMMREAELAGYAPKNPDSCSAFSGCPYLPVCSHETTIEDDSLYRTADTAHEELNTETAES